LKKGFLDKEHVLIELEDIEAGTGKITNLERVVTEIGSDKTYLYVFSTIYNHLILLTSTASKIR
jgi:hypothetical protein